MYGSGVRIGMMGITIKVARGIILMVQVVVSTVSCAAVRGVSLRGACAQRIVSGTIPTSASTPAVGFGWPFSPVASKFF